MSKIYNQSGGYRRLHSFNFATIIHRATGLLGRQLEQLERVFVAQGGIKEKMFQARQEARVEPDAPECPECATPMKRRQSAKGPFWGCANYPQCKGTRKITPTTKSPSHEVNKSKLPR